MIRVSVALNVKTDSEKHALQLVRGLFSKLPHVFQVVNIEVIPDEEETA